MGAISPRNVFANKAEASLPDPILVTTVDLGGGASAQLIIREGQDPATAVTHFCNAQDLSESIREALLLHVLESMEHSQLSLGMKEDDPSNREEEEVTESQGPSHDTNVRSPHLCR